MRRSPARFPYSSSRFAGRRSKTWYNQGMKKGKIIPNGVILKPHELATVVLLTECGWTVELIPKSERYGERTPDMKVGGLLWEMKGPTGSGKWLIKNTVQRASHQAENVVIDLRRVKIHQTRCLAELEKQFQLSKRLKQMVIITKSKKVVELSK